METEHESFEEHIVSTHTRSEEMVVNIVENTNFEVGTTSDKILSIQKTSNGKENKTRKDEPKADISVGNVRIKDVIAEKIVRKEVNRQENIEDEHGAKYVLEEHEFGKHSLTTVKEGGVMRFERPRDVIFEMATVQKKLLYTVTYMANERDHYFEKISTSTGELLLSSGKLDCLRVLYLSPRYSSCLIYFYIPEEFPSSLLAGVVSSETLQQQDTVEIFTKFDINTLMGAGYLFKEIQMLGWNWIIFLNLVSGANCRIMTKQTLKNKLLVFEVKLSQNHKIIDILSSYTTNKQHYLIFKTRHEHQYQNYMFRLRAL